MFVIIIKFFSVAIALLLSFYMLGAAFRKARRLDARIRELKREQEEQARNGVPSNPYAELAALYAERERQSTRER